MKNEQTAEQILALREAIIVAEQFVKVKQIEFEESILEQKKALTELNEKKKQLEQEFIQTMKEENIGSFKTDNATITSNKRVTLKLVNEEQLKNFILENASDLKSYVKDSIKTKDELIDIVAPRKITATSVEFLSKRYNDITGEVLPGIEKSETNFLTIKSI